MIISCMMLIVLDQSSIKIYIITQGGFYLILLCTIFLMLVIEIFFLNVLSIEPLHFEDVIKYRNSI